MTGAQTQQCPAMTLDFFEPPASEPSSGILPESDAIAAATASSVQEMVCTRPTKR